VATIAVVLEELYPLQAEHRHLDIGYRWEETVVRESRTTVEMQPDKHGKQGNRDSAQYV
jgi:hypothetical protein